MKKFFTTIKYDKVLNKSYIMLQYLRYRNEINDPMELYIYI